MALSFHYASSYGMSGPYPCPYGEVGDRLWVRETWVELIAVSPSTDKPIDIGAGERLIEPPTQNPNGRWNYDGKVIAYRANSNIEFCDEDGSLSELAYCSNVSGWHPSIHMPRWASRITLEITNIRVERLQDISEEDAQAEGVERPILDVLPPAAVTDIWPFHPHTGEYRDGFRELWDSINAKRGYGWDLNPWVWVIEFKKVEE